MPSSTRRPGPLLLAALVAAGCSNPTTVAGPLSPGPWGGEHITLLVREDGASAELDCAAGQVNERLVADEEGRVTAVGTFTPGTGGPVHEDRPPPTYTARYEGVLEGGTLTLRIVVPDLDQVVGPFTLRHGEEGRLLRCL